MARLSVLPAALAVAAIAGSVAASAAICNPMNVTAACPPIPGLTNGNYFMDFTTMTTTPPDWILADYATVNYAAPNGANFTFAKRYDAPYIWSRFYMLFGRIEVVMQVAPGQGVITGAVMMSDDMDEIDWEFSGNNFAKSGGWGQTNYFGQGQIGWSDRGTTNAVDNPQGKFHTYAFDWQKDRLIWSIDGVTVRTLNNNGATSGSYMFPQTPSRLHLGMWDGGDPGNAPGTINWAGGVTNFNNTPYSAFVKSVKITTNNTCNSYQYPFPFDGTYKSVQCSNGTVTLPCTYAVVAGDDGYKIAKNLTCNFDSLQVANPGVNWDKLLLGQVLLVPGGICPAFSTTTSMPSTSSMFSTTFMLSNTTSSVLSTTTPMPTTSSASSVMSTTTPSSTTTSAPYVSLISNILMNSSSTALYVSLSSTTAISSSSTLSTTSNSPVLTTPGITTTSSASASNSTTVTMSATSSNGSSTSLNLTSTSLLTASTSGTSTTMNSSVLTASSSGSSTSTSTGSVQSYTVVSGDFGWAIANKSGCTFDALRAANPGTDWDHLQVGQTVNVPGGGSGSSAASTASATSGAIVPTGSASTTLPASSTANSSSVVAIGSASTVQSSSSTTSYAPGCISGWGCGWGGYTVPPGSITANTTGGIPYGNLPTPSSSLPTGSSTTNPGTISASLSSSSLTTGTSMATTSVTSLSTTSSNLMVLSSTTGTSTSGMSAPGTSNSASSGTSSSLTSTGISVSTSAPGTNVAVQVPNSTASTSGSGSSMAGTPVSTTPSTAGTSTPNPSSSPAASTSAPASSPATTTSGTTASSSVNVVQPVTTAPKMFCNQDNCLRNVIDPRYTSQMRAFCSKYTTVTSNTTPLPTFLSGCSANASRVSSACSCLITSFGAGTATGSAAATPSAFRSGAPSGRQVPSWMLKRAPLLRWNPFPL